MIICCVTECWNYFGYHHNRQKKWRRTWIRNDIWGTVSSNYEDWCLDGCDSWSGRSVPTFQINMLPALGQLSCLVVDTSSLSNMFWHISTGLCSVANYKTAVFMNTYVTAAEPECTTIWWDLYEKLGLGNLVLKGWQILVLETYCNETMSETVCLFACARTWRTCTHTGVYMWAHMCGPDGLLACFKVISGSNVNPL